MKHDSLYIIMPAYNEEKNIGTVIEQWYPVVERIGGESRLVILNDGSRDGTYEMIRKYQKKYERLIGIDKPNEGHGGTILRGYHYAVDAGADYIFQTDSDGQTLPDEFWQFWKKRKTCGLLIGYRKKKRRWFFQAFCDKSAETGTVSDLWDMGKRCEYTVSSDECETVVESAEKDPGRIFLSNVLMTVIYEKHHLHVEYIPITFRPRQAGKNSINMKRIIKIGRQAFGDFIRLRHRI